MKITWFADATFRIHIAGRIVVTDPAGAPEGVDAAELAAGAQTVVSTTGPDLPAFDPASWRPRRRARLIDEREGDEGLNLYRLGGKGLVLDSADEGLLVVAPSRAEVAWNRWADGAVAVLAGTGAHCAAQGTALLDIARPRLVALAVTDGESETAFGALAPILGDASLIVLESGLAVEV